MSWLAASTVRIMTYNLLNFQDENDREDDFVAIIDFVEPDLIIAEEIVAQTGFSHFKSDVLDVLEPDAWSSAAFTNQSASLDIALFYRHDHFTFISTDVVYTAQSSGTRDVIEWIMVHNQSSVQFNVYGVHFKASSGESNAQERLQEATILRTYLNNLNENYFIVAGDFNIYSNSSSSEPAFDMLTGNANNNNGRLFDPIDRIGPWHSNSSYADVHTQSTCNHESGHNGGANGGLDDRFDWLFVSEVILDTSSEMRYVENTYWAVGNDGDHHNKSINFGNNSSVSDAIADALHDASDHLPVYMDVWFDDLTYNDAGIVITEIMPNPGAVSDSYGEWIEIHNTTDSTIDIEGWMIKDAGSDEHVISNDAMSILVVPGDYFILARNGNEALNGGLVADYAYTGFTLSNSEDEIILNDSSGAIVDEVHYTNAWIFGNGIAMEIHDLESNNNVAENWYASTVQYGDGDYGTPGTDWQGTVGIDEKIGIAETFLLHPPYPNPFNPVITIRYTIPVSGQYAIHIYSVTGRLIKTLIDNHFSAGHYAAKWDASGLASGVYWLKMESVNHIQVNKITLVQ
jgi:endonuclease/exonuclease/phosphatase family metal-dependent hydrolase